MAVPRITLLFAVSALALGALSTSVGAAPPREAEQRAADAAAARSSSPSHVAPASILLARPASHVRLNACASLIVFESRGTDGNESVSKPSRAFISHLRDEVRARDPSLTLAVVPNPYPAWGSLPGFISALAKLPQAYHKSVTQGKAWLATTVRSFRSSCSTSKFILTGYSQGAHVTGDVYQSVGTANVLGVVLFGDPKFNSSDSAARGGAGVGSNGSLGTRSLFSTLPGSGSVGRVLSYCHARDPVCAGLPKLRHGQGDHTNYQATNEPRQAAHYLARFVPMSSTTPEVVRVDGASAPLGTREFWVTVHFRDRECDIVRGTWYGPDGSGAQPRDFGGPARCSNGQGSFQAFSTTCSAPGQPRGRWVEYITLRDARGNVSPRYAFVHECT